MTWMYVLESNVVRLERVPMIDDEVIEQSQREGLLKAWNFAEFQSRRHLPFVQRDLLLAMNCIWRRT